MNAIALRCVNIYRREWHLYLYICGYIVVVCTCLIIHIYIYVYINETYASIILFIFSSGLLCDNTKIPNTLRNTDKIFVNSQFKNPDTYLVVAEFNLKFQNINCAFNNFLFTILFLPQNIMYNIVLYVV